MSDDLISRKFLLECAEYDNNGRLIIPYRYVKNAPTAFDKEKVLDELGELTGEECTLHECVIRSEKCKACIAKKAAEIVDRGGQN